jgi:hypothetical protein
LSRFVLAAGEVMFARVGRLSIHVLRVFAHVLGIELGFGLHCVLFCAML